MGLKKDLFLALSQDLISSFWGWNLLMLLAHSSQKHLSFQDHEQPAAEKEEDTKVIKVVTFINLYLISCNNKNYMHCKNRLINCP